MGLQPAGLLPATGIDDNKIVESDGGNEGKSAKSDFTKPIRRAEEPSFLALDARQIFTQLGQVFTKAPILQHFDSEHHIQIETNASGYAIGYVLCQITSEMCQ